MEGLTVVTHPLVQHKLTLMRDKNTSTAGFRQLLREIALLLTYEVTRDLKLTTTAIETPLTPMMAPILEGKKLVFASILRAGNGLLEGMLDLVPAARVAHIGIGQARQHSDCNQQRRRYTDHFRGASQLFTQSGCGHYGHHKPGHSCAVWIRSHRD